MPYVILVLSLLVGFYALYRFFIQADVTQIKSALRIFILVIYAAIILFFAVTGRIIVSLALIILAIPVTIAYLKKKMKNKQ